MKFKVGDKIRIKESHEIVNPHLFSHSEIYTVIVVKNDYVKLDGYSCYYFTKFFVPHDETAGFVIE